MSRSRQIVGILASMAWPRSEEHTSELQSLRHLVWSRVNTTRRSSDLYGGIVAAYVSGVVRLQDVALQADRGDLGFHGLAHHRGEGGALVGRHDQQIGLLADEGFHLSHLLAVVLLRIGDDQLHVGIRCEQFGHERVLRGAIRLGVVALAERPEVPLIPSRTRPRAATKT